MEAFIFKSTFIGDGPDIIRDLNPENTMKFFSQPDPGLILFYDPQTHIIPQMELDIAYEEISNKILVLKADVTAPATRNLASLLNIDFDSMQTALLKIVVPGAGHKKILKYSPKPEFPSKFLAADIK